MSRVVFMCGPAGSGKSTVARRLEGDGFTRLSFDQETWSRGHREMPLPPAIHAEIDAGLRRRLAELLRSGSDVVLDFSFWSRAMRDDWRSEVAQLGVVPEIISVVTDRATALQRISAPARSITATTSASIPLWPPPTSISSSRPPRMRGR